MVNVGKYTLHGWLIKVNMPYMDGMGDDFLVEIRNFVHTKKKGPCKKWEKNYPPIPLAQLPDAFCSPTVSCVRAQTTVHIHQTEKVPLLGGGRSDTFAGNSRRSQASKRFRNGY